MVDISDEKIADLKNKGLTCSKINARVSKEMSDAKRARQDSEFYKTFGIESQAELQSKIADAEEKSASFNRELRKRLCPLR